MSRDALLTPQRIRYVRTQEHKLFKSLMDVAGSKQDELRQMMDAMLDTIGPKLQDEAATFEFTGVDVPADYVVKDGRVLRECHSQVGVYDGPARTFLRIFKVTFVQIIVNSTNVTLRTCNV